MSANNELNPIPYGGGQPECIIHPSPPPTPLPEVCICTPALPPYRKYVDVGPEGGDMAVPAGEMRIPPPPLLFILNAAAGAAAGAGGNVTLLQENIFTFHILSFLYNVLSPHCSYLTKRQSNCNVHKQ